MGVYTHDHHALEWRGGHEIVRIEPWGPGGLRVRGTVWEKIRDELPGALIRGWHGSRSRLRSRSRPTRRGSATAA